MFQNTHTAGVGRRWRLSGHESEKYGVSNGMARLSHQRRSASPRPMAMRIRSAVWLTPSFSLMRLSVLATVL